MHRRIKHPQLQRHIDIYEEVALDDEDEIAETCVHPMAHTCTVLPVMLEAVSGVV